MANLDLLQVFHERASADPARSGLNGKLCVAIARPGDVRRWVADCSEEGDSFAFVDAFPTGCDALLIATESDLQAALSGALAEDAQIVVRGDAQLFEAFCERYFRSLSPHALRARLEGAR